MVVMDQGIWTLTTCSKVQVVTFNLMHFLTKIITTREEKGVVMDETMDSNSSSSSSNNNMLNKWVGNNSNLLACRVAKRIPTTMLDGQIKPEAGVVVVPGGKAAKDCRSYLDYT